MKILHVCYHFYPCVGGIEKYVEGLCKNLIKLGHQSDVLCLNTCVHKEKLPKYQQYADISIYRVPYIDLKYYKIVPTLLKYVKDYDIIHIHGLGFFFDYLAMTKLFHGKMLVLSTHGGIFHTKKLYFLKKLYFNLWSKFIIRYVDKVIADGMSDVELFSKITSDIEVIPNTIETKYFSSIKRNPEENTLLYIGRISKNKRVDNLVRMLYFLKKDVPNVKLYIVGEDWEGLKNGLEELVERKGLKDNIYFVGKAKDDLLYEHLSKCHLFVSASEYEGGIGITLIEAMATGCPVVANDIQPTRDLITNGKTGFIVNYDQPQETANLIKGLLEQDLSGVCNNAKKASKQYDWDNMAEKIEEVYAKVINQ